MSACVLVMSLGKNCFFFWITLAKCVLRMARQGRIQGGVLGVKTPTLFGKFFQLARGFYEKIPKPPLNFPFYTKNFKTPALKNFSIRPCVKMCLKIAEFLPKY